MARTTKVVGFSLPPAMARAIEQTARAEQKTKSELLRDMWEAYQIVNEEKEFGMLQRAMSRHARSQGLEIRTEADVDRILHQG